MRSFVFSLFVLPFAFALSAEPQAQRPQFRPAVLGSGPDSLVNRIDVKELLKKGQKEGAVQFCAVVAPSGASNSAWTYGAMPGSDALEEEVQRRLAGVKFTPAIYQHQPVGVLLYGTVIFSSESPHLRILLNQDPNELKEAKDFIGPQPVVGGDSKFTGLHMPEAIPVAVDGVVALVLQVDEKGNLQELDVAGETPPLLGFRTAALTDFREAKFIPAFRDGDPAESRSVMSVCYKPVGIEVDLEP